MVWLVLVIVSWLIAKAQFFILFAVFKAQEHFDKLSVTQDFHS
jgi:hypothetical protein